MTETEKEEGICCNCKFWNTEDSYRNYGECRRRSPTIVLGQMPGVIDAMFKQGIRVEINRASWPETHFAEWCGEYKGK